MEIVINIPDNVFKRLVAGEVKYGGITARNIFNLVKGGTPLPKGHGNLVDYEEMKNNAREYGTYVEATLSHIKPKTIIEADKEE